MKRLRRRQKIDKYQIEKLLAQGGFAHVYQARDLIEGISVALKIPFLDPNDATDRESFRREVHVSAGLDHPGILRIKDARIAEGRFLIAYHLGIGSLADRMTKRISPQRALLYAEQILAALAHAHARRVLHCDVKPENFILFSEDRLRLADFGLARLTLRTLQGSGSGTLGYLAPEQAMGRPSFRSDVFSAGLILYRLFAGVLPQWPYSWPGPGHDRLRQSLSAPFIDMIRRACHVDAHRRFEDAVAFLTTFERIQAGALRPGRRRRKPNGKKIEFRELEWKHFRRVYGRILQTRHTCHRCQGPVSAAMTWCPWCGAERRKIRVEHDFPRTCSRCGRGQKSDWAYCAWCYGPRNPDPSPRSYTDRRYVAKCTSPGCHGDLMPFMRYCPWCHRRVKRRWTIEGLRSRCKKCSWGVVPDHWKHCPWCGTKQRANR